LALTLDDDDEEYGPVITDPTSSTTPCDAGVHVLCCHECTCACHQDDE
jgi:hypothetical protein